MDCLNCQYFLPTADAQGICRRNPTTVFLKADESTISLFSQMFNSGVCGKFKEKVQ